MTCKAATVVVGGVSLSTNVYENAQQLINLIGDDSSDVTQDEYETSIANGNNVAGTTGIQIPAPTQTTPPGPITAKPVATNDTTTPTKQTPGTTCLLWDGQNYDLQLSPNFTLRLFTVGYGTNSPLNSQRGCLFPNELVDLPGLDRNTRLCNLQALSLHVCEPLYARYPNMRINSAIRNQNTVPNGVSQHVKGQAADVQMNGWSYDQYWAAAGWIKDNINFDQFIFEHSEKTRSAWLHLSFNRDGNRGTVLTMYRNQYSPGLKRMF